MLTYIDIVSECTEETWDYVGWRQGGKSARIFRHWQSGHKAGVVVAGHGPRSSLARTGEFGPWPLVRKPRTLDPMAHRQPMVGGR